MLTFLQRKHACIVHVWNESREATISQFLLLSLTPWGNTETQTHGGLLWGRSLVRWMEAGEIQQEFYIRSNKAAARSLSTGRFWHQPQCERVGLSSVCSAKHYRRGYFTPYGSIYTILPSQQNCLLHWLIGRHSEMYPSFSQNESEWTSKCFIFPYRILPSFYILGQYAFKNDLNYCVKFTRILKPLQWCKINISGCAPIKLSSYIVTLPVS